jgi:adenylate cyclase
MERIRLRDAGIAGAIALLLGVAVASPVFDAARGMSLDLLTMLRWRAFGNAQTPESSRAVVVALDEETFRTPPFEGTPSVTWTRPIGRVLSAIIEGDASVVGFDIIFPTSIEQSAMPFGDATLGERVRGFDRDYLRALALSARAGKVVLGAVQHQDTPVQPSPGQRAAVGFGANTRLLNLHNDPDDVVRRLPLSFSIGGATVPSMAVELATRANGGAVLRRDSGAVAGTITLDFAGGAEDVPTYSLADLAACAEKGDKDFFRHQFAGKVVLFGTLLDVEDRKITTKRYATAPESASGARCALAHPAATAKVVRDTIPGVYIHATAVNNLLRGYGVTEPGRIQVAAISFVTAGLMALAALAFGPLVATLAWVGGVVLWTALATMTFRMAVALPLIEPSLASLAALGLTIGYRFAVADRDKRFLRQSFALYLPPFLIEKMVTAHKPPALGGEVRPVTVYFSDLADFSTMSEQVTPATLVSAMNEYLSAMTDIIEAHGGYVDKYIGDAIVAVFGAPVDDPDHAAHAVAAALACAARLASLERMRAVFRNHSVRQRIGLNSGDALVGNIGSHRRFNYTVMGDTVNLASRLEGANKVYGTTIMAAETTVSRAGPAVAWRELDTIRVKGRDAPVAVFEPLGAADVVTPAQRDCAEGYARGLALFRARDFAGAVTMFARTASHDPPSAVFLARAQAFVDRPPGADWGPIHALDEK